jgi:hypothetical protein
MGGGNRGSVPPQQQRANNAEQGRRPQPPQPQLPPRGGPRAELPGGNPQPRVPSWSDDNAQPPVPRSSLDTPRGHDEPDATSQMPRVNDRQGPGAAAPTSEFPRIDDRQGPGSTGEFPPSDFDAPRPGAGPQQGNGQFVRPDVFGTPNPSAAGQNGAGQNGSADGQFGRQDPSTTGQFSMPGYDGGSTGQYGAPGRDVQQETGQFERPGANGPRPPQRPQRPQPRRRPALPQEPEALPPAGPGDGRTPLYDTLETNWFNQVQGDNGAQGEPAPQQPAPAPSGPTRSASAPSPSASWRATPNDELGRQAERVRQPSAGGVTVSGLPRRVPRANLVAGTAQQQQHQSGPQVSRAPDDVRGRLTNLRRGIQQGREAGTGQTGSFPSPTHQQER